jgi:hypothetical protein
MNNIGLFPISISGRNVEEDYMTLSIQHLLSCAMPAYESLVGTYMSYFDYKVLYFSLIQNKGQEKSISFG